MRKVKNSPLPGPESEWIADTERLDEFCEHVRGVGVVAVDTEFHHERHFLAKLALVQLATPERIACVDPLVEDVSFSSLKALLHDASVLKVLHAARQDLEIFYHLTGAVPSPIFDTQVAASLVGFGYQLGCGVLVEKVTGCRLTKAHGRTDWMRRPIDSDVLQYAADDVRHLCTVYRELDAHLTRLGRRDWLDEEQAILVAPATYELDLDNAWRRVKGAVKLRGVDTAVAKAVAAWREATAHRLDRPRRWVLPDRIIMDLARQKPTEMNQLERMRGLSEGTRKENGSDLLALVARAVESPPSDWPSPQKPRPGPADKTLVDAIAAVLHHRAEESAISAELLASRGDLKRIAAGERDLPAFQGWRRRLAGQALLDFLSGESCLRVQDGRLILA